VVEAPHNKAVGQCTLFQTIVGWAAMRARGLGVCGAPESSHKMADRGWIWQRTINASVVHEIMVEEGFSNYVKEPKIQGAVLSAAMRDAVAVDMDALFVPNSVIQRGFRKRRGRPLPSLQDCNRI
jgi:hypothetical protein